MKYIIIEKHGMLLAMTFDALIDHCEAAAGWKIFAFKIVSAGFVKFVDGEPLVYGESFTLKIKSRPQDAAIIKASMARKLPSEMVP